MRHILLIAVSCILLACAGCAADGTIKNPFASDDPPPANSYYFSEFSDIPIPNEMSESRADTFITFAHSGVKCGVQHFSGRVETVSLMNTMRRFMSSNGWTMRSLLRSKESIIVFEKPDRIATMQISDGAISTTLRLFVSSKLEGDAGGADINAYAPAQGSDQQQLSQ